jgi:NADH-quinone oxidoreductase subunit L
MALFDGKVIDGIVNATAVVTRGFSYFIGHFDNKVIDGLVNLTATATGFGGIVLRKFQTGRVQTYVIFVVIAIMIMLW